MKKKYWIKDLTDNQAIHAPTREIAQKLCKKFNELGLKIHEGVTGSIEDSWEIYKTDTVYIPGKEALDYEPWARVVGFEILTVDQLLDNHPDKKYTAQDSFGEWRVFYEKPKRNLFFWEGNKEQGEVLSKPLVEFKGSWEDSLHELVEDRFVKIS